MKQYTKLLLLAAMIIIFVAPTTTSAIYYEYEWVQNHRIDQSYTTWTACYDDENLWLSPNGDMYGYIDITDSHTLYESVDVLDYKVIISMKKGSDWNTGDCSIKRVEVRIRTTDAGETLRKTLVLNSMSGYWTVYTIDLTADWAGRTIAANIMGILNEGDYVFSYFYFQFPYAYRYQRFIGGGPPPI